MNCDIAIIGGGPAGMAAAVKAFDEGVTDVIIIERDGIPGGILNQCIHNGFGLHRFKKELTGPEYAAIYENMVRERGIKVLTETTVTDISKDNTVMAINQNGIIKINAKAVILAMGCRERSRGALNIPGTRPSGIFSAGTAQRLMNISGMKIGKTAVILGSGDIGLIMARRMTLEGMSVKAVCEILPYSGGLKRNIIQCLDDYGIPLYLSTTVAEIHGNDRIEGVTLACVDENRRIIESTKRYIACDTLLLSVGLIPENELTTSSGIALDGITNGAITDEYRQTLREGVFACGNVLQVHDLVDYVSYESELAGKSAAKYVKEGNFSKKTVNVIPGNGVRYVVPQKIHTNNTEDIDLFFRVSNPTDNVKITVKSGGNTLFSKSKIRVLPGEMEKITIKSENPATINSDITVEISENAE